MQPHGHLAGIPSGQRDVNSTVVKHENICCITDIAFLTRERGCAAIPHVEVSTPCNGVGLCDTDNVDFPERGSHQGIGRLFQFKETFSAVAHPGK